MRCVALLVVVMLTAGAAPSRAQTAAPSSDPPVADAPPADLPVSLERIREGLKRAPDQPLREGLARQADFRVEILEQARLDALLKKMDFKSGPAPAGGLYGYEQQRRLFSPLDRPLMQPYAAFSGGELITIAIQNLIARYLGKPLIDSLGDANRARAERAAKEEVDQAIAEYCAGRADRWMMQLCTPDR